MAKTIAENIEILSSKLKTQKLRVVTAESCTGGGIAKALTDFPGSSEWFECGFITYSNASKQSMLNVDMATLSQQGAVSEAIAIQMAKGALARSAAQLSVAVSGVAGPSGGLPDKPVGTVWIAWALEEKVRATCFHFQGDREAVRYQAIEAAVGGLIETLARR